MSATLRVTDFTKNPVLFASPDLPVVNVQGRQHPVAIHFNRRTRPDYLQEAYAKVVKIHARLPPGAILVFLTGEKEILGLCRKLEKRYSAQAIEARQQRRQELAIRSVTHNDAKVPAFQDVATPDPETIFPMDARSGVVEAEDDPNEADNATGNVDEHDVVNDSDSDALDSDADTEQDDGRINEELGLDEGVGVDRALVLCFARSRARLMWIGRTVACLAAVFAPAPVASKCLCLSHLLMAIGLLLWPPMWLKHHSPFLASNMWSMQDGSKRSAQSSAHTQMQPVDRFVGQRHYDHVSGLQQYRISWISKASADQRAGRAGRVGPGHCYRLYSSAIFESCFEAHSQPEILRMPIEGIVLQMKSMNIDSVANFPFPTPPDRDALRVAEQTLVNLGALAPLPAKAHRPSKITDLGRAMALFPLAPRYAKMLVSGHQHGCLPYVIAMVCALSVGELFIREDTVGDQDSDQEADGIASGLDLSTLNGIKSDDIKVKEHRRLQRRAFYKAQSVRCSSLLPLCTTHSVMMYRNLQHWAEVQVMFSKCSVRWELSNMLVAQQPFAMKTSCILR